MYRESSRMPRPSITAILVASLACLAGAPAAGETRPEPGVVVVRGISAGDLLNLRATASATGIVLGRLPNGTPLRLENCDKVGSYRWCRVEVADETGLRGWTPARYLHDPDTQLTMDEALAAREPAEGRVAEGDGGAGAPPPVSPEDLGAELLAPRASTRSGPDLTQTVLLSALAAREGPGADLLTAFDGRHEAANIDAARDALARSVTARVDPSAVELYTLSPAAEAASAPEPGEGVAAPGVPIPTPRPDPASDFAPAVASLSAGLAAENAGTARDADAPTGTVRPTQPVAEAEPATPTETALDRLDLAPPIPADSAPSGEGQPSIDTEFAAAIETALDRLALAPPTPAADLAPAGEPQLTNATDPSPAAETALDRLASAPPISLDLAEPAATRALVEPPQPSPSTPPPAPATPPAASAAPSPASTAPLPAPASPPVASADPTPVPPTPSPAPATAPVVPQPAASATASVIPPAPPAPPAIVAQQPPAAPAPAREAAPVADTFAVAQAPATGARFDATGAIPCARYLGQPMTRCEAGVTRTGPDASDVTVNWPDGGTRIIRFRDGQPEGANARGEFRFTREADLHMIRVGTGERFEITDALAFGE